MRKSAVLSVKDTQVSLRSRLGMERVASVVTAVNFSDGVTMADISFGRAANSSALVAPTEKSAKRSQAIGISMNDLGHTVLLAPIMMDGSVGAAEVPIDKAALPDFIDVLRRVYQASLDGSGLLIC